MIERLWGARRHDPGEEAINAGGGGLRAAGVGVVMRDLVVLIAAAPGRGQWERFACREARRRYPPSRSEARLRALDDPDSSLDRRPR